MWPITAKFQAALRTSGTIFSTATHRDPFTAKVTPLPIVDGEVKVDSTSNVRRSLQMQCPSTQGLYDALSAPGGEVTVTQTVRYVDRSTETVPLGVFRVGADQLGYGPGDTLQLNCPDRWSVVQLNRFGVSRKSVKTNAVYQEIQRLVEGAWPNGAYPFPGWASIDTSVTSKVGPLLWSDGNREAAITKLAAIGTLQVFFDAQGLGVIRPAPVLTSASVPVWTVDAAQKGVMIAANRSRDRAKTRNAVIVFSSATDLNLAPQEKKSTSVSEPLSTVGPLGYQPFYFTAPYRTTAQMQAAAVYLLSKYLGQATTLTLTAVSNPALDADDVIGALLPKTDLNLPRPFETHIIESVTIPLMPNGTQTINTRATRPTADDSV